MARDELLTIQTVLDLQHWLDGEGLDMAAICRAGRWQVTFTPRREVRPHPITGDPITIRRKIEATLTVGFGETLLKAAIQAMSRHLVTKA